MTGQHEWTNPGVHESAGTSRPRDGHGRPVGWSSCDRTGHEHGQCETPWGLAVTRLVVRPSPETPRVPCAADTAAPLRCSTELFGLELWALRVGDAVAGRLDLSVLDRDEQRRAARLADDGDRLSYLATHAVLRHLLGERLGLPPHAIAFTREPCPSCGAPHGRPALAGSASSLHFSLSHSAGVGMIAIARAPVGVDIEAQPDPEVVTDVSALLHPAEHREICSAAPSGRVAAFTRIWARKEAYLKATGQGIAHDLGADYLGGEESPGGPDDWSVLDVPAPAGYAAAVAVAASGDPT